MADNYIVQQEADGDLVITADIPLAAEVLEKGGEALNPRGEFYTRETIRQKLADNRLVEPLFDTPRFARNLEKVYKEMWEIFSAGEKPRQIEVVES